MKSISQRYIYFQRIKNKETKINAFKKYVENDFCKLKRIELNKRTQRNNPFGSSV